MKIIDKELKYSLNQKIDDILDSQKFYEFLQAYRHAPISNQKCVSDAYEDIKTFIKERLTNE